MVRLHQHTSGFKSQLGKNIKVDQDPSPDKKNKAGKKGQKERFNICAYPSLESMQGFFFLEM